MSERHFRLVMGYRFTGFFCDGDDTVLEAALGRWPFRVGRVIRSAFHGIGIRCPDLDDVWDSEQGPDYWEDRIHSVEEQLPGFSTMYPALTFAFIKAECLGGDCEYAGFVTQNGQVLLKVEFDHAGVDNLRQLLKPLGVRLLRDTSNLSVGDTGIPFDQQSSAIIASPRSPGPLVVSSPEARLRTNALHEVVCCSFGPVSHPQNRRPTGSLEHPYPGAQDGDGQANISETTAMLSQRDRRCRRPLQPC